MLAMVGGSTIGATALHELNDRHVVPPSHTTSETTLAVAEVVYPPSIEISEGFVEGYLSRLREERVDRVARTASGLDRYARREFDIPFADLSKTNRNQLLRHLGVDRVISRPEGTLAERVRYHLVNSLLYALFTTPKGSRLFEIENPVGYPGGLEDYQPSP